MRNKKTEPIRLLAMDLDGTILTNDKRITTRTKEALLAAIEEGIEVVPVTGRPFSGMPEELMGISGIRYVITSNGAVTQDVTTGQILRSSLIDAEIAEDIIRIPLEKGLLYNTFQGGIGYSDENTFQRMYRIYEKTPLFSYVKKSRRGCPDIHGWIRGHGSGVENIWIVGNDRAERDEINARVLEQWNLHTVLTAERDLEIGNPQADKGLALQDLAELLRIPADEILALGDNENDLGMFRVAGTAAVMGNAADAIKQYGSIVADSNEDDGAAKVIETILKAR